MLFSYNKPLYILSVVGRVGFGECCWRLAKLQEPCSQLWCSRTIAVSVKRKFKVIHAKECYMDLVQLLSWETTNTI